MSGTRPGAIRSFMTDNAVAPDVEKSEQRSPSVNARREHSSSLKPQGRTLSAAALAFEEQGLSVQGLIDAARKRGGVAHQFAKKVESIDKDGNGMVDGLELVDAVVELVNEQQQRKVFFIVALISMITTIISIAVICGLSVVIAVRLKDTAVAGNTLTVKGSMDPIRVANTDMMVVNGTLVSRSGDSSDPISVNTKLMTRQDCPINYDDDTLVHMDMLSVPLPSGDHLYLRVDGFVRGDGTMTIFTPLGAMQLADKCATMTGTGIEYLSSMGYFTLRQGRHLLGPGFREIPKTTLRWGSVGTFTQQKVYDYSG